MKSQWLVLVMLLGGIRVLAQTTVPGGQVGGTWAAAGSPYLVEGSIMVPDDSTLTIQPGVDVIFQGHYKLLVLGRILAVGSVSDSIFFIAADTANGWYGIRFDNTPSTNDTSRLEYCGISRGIANGSGNDLYGGGINFNNFSKAHISNCRISHNRAAKGAGIYLNSSSPIISNSTVSLNHATGTGGGIYCDSSNPMIVNNSIKNNFALSGGGISSRVGNPIITGNDIFNNTASYGGGGIYASGGSSALEISHNVINSNHASGNNAGGIYIDGPLSASILHNEISNNTAFVSGGGIMCYSNSTMSTIAYNHISNNTAIQNGGGIACVTDASATVHDNVISNNSASIRGGGVYCSFNSDPGLVNNTISNNHCSGIGGALFCAGSSSPTFVNCIVYGNTAATSGSQVYLLDESSAPDFRYCDVMDGVIGFEVGDNFYMGTYLDNVDTVPQFVAPSTGTGAGFDGVNADWSLSWSSPCIDAGDPAGSYPNLDIAGNTRVVGVHIDMGAYEFAGATAIQEGAGPGFEVYPDPTSGVITVVDPAVRNCTNITVLDVAGRILYHELNPASICTVDLGKYQSGIYFVRMEFANGRSLVKQVVKQ